MHNTDILYNYMLYISVACLQYLILTVNGQKVLLPPRFPIRTHVKPLFVECLEYRGNLSYSDYFYMVVFSDDFSNQ